MRITVTKKDGKVYRVFQPAMQLFTRFLNGRCEIVVVAGGHRYVFDPEYYTVNCDEMSRES